MEKVLTYEEQCLAQLKKIESDADGAYQGRADGGVYIKAIFKSLMVIFRWMLFK